MDNPYTVVVDGTSEFQLSKEDIASLDIIKTSPNGFHLLKDGISYHIQMIDSDFNTRTYTVIVNGTEHQVSINTPLDGLIKAMGFASNGQKSIDSIVAPMPGLILDILVQEGQDVKEDDQLLILEAMKMENIIASPRSGTIKTLGVKKGDAVDKKQLLIEFE
ncbi:MULTISPECIES: biotin/lipoyl-containing protein [Flavobacteriaceae]|uniref:biotin/lipoyl-containing protein n=1 Tax=Flavobacteriaceae TaxID=49546 RepID=UPI00234A3698|nr:acetyl-CoA carboxylase biotin carboxyl carrier protein subunit [Muricauda sp. SP22]MDC6362843.1 biotin/lipoyl-binding protein [Muricauda sp. SP22]